MTIKVPTTAAFGYYYAATFSRVNKDGKKDQTDQALIIGATATLVLLEVDSPNAKRQLSIDSFTADKDWYEFLPATFSVVLSNIGNVHSRVGGEIYISRSGSEEVIDSLKVNELQGNILPSSKRTFTNTWNQGFPRYSEPSIQENQVPKAELEWDFKSADQLRFGKYTAHIALVYDDGTRDVLLEDSVDFWVIPWRIILAILVIGGLTLFGIVMIIRSIWKLSQNRRDTSDF